MNEGIWWFLPFADEVPDRRGREHDLGDDGPAVAVHTGGERLGDDSLQSGRELRADLLLLVRRIDVDDTVDRLRRALGVQRGEHEVSRFRRGERGRRRLQVAQLADEDDVRVLAQGVLERRRERVRVLADLALVDQAHLVRVQELDRVLDRDDVRGPGAVRQVEQRRQGGRLARTRRSGHEDEAAVQLGELGDRLGNAEFVQRLDVVGDRAEGPAVGAALLVQVDAEAGDARHVVGEVVLVALLELFPVLVA